MTPDVSGNGEKADSPVCQDSRGWFVPCAAGRTLKNRPFASCTAALTACWGGTLGGAIGNCRPGPIRHTITTQAGRLASQQGAAASGGSVSSHGKIGRAHI